MFSDLSTDFYDLGVHLDVPFVPTSERVVDAMLELAGVEADDILYDLGSGDGRIVVAAAHKFGASAVGVEIDAGRLGRAQAYAEQMGVEHKVCFIEDDLLEVDFSPATVVTMFLLPTINLALRPWLLKELRPGTRIVSHTFDMGRWRPDRWVPAGEDGIFLWVIPAQVAGTWAWQSNEGLAYRLELEQRYQEISATLCIDSQPIELEKALLWGDLLELVISGPEDGEPESLIMHCQPEHLMIVSGSQRGIVAAKQ